MRKLIDQLDWVAAGVAYILICWAGDADSAMTAGDLAPVIPLYVIAWRMPTLGDKELP